MFNFQRSGNEGLPVAAVSYYGITDQYPEGWCLRIDPAHLETRLTKLYLIAGRSLAVTIDEANSLVAIVEGLYHDHGWRVRALSSDQWYLVVPDDPGVVTTPLASAIGRDVDALLPAGTNESLWHARMNEIQMAFHTAPVNAAREAQERYTINTIWPWGSGALPGLMPSVWRGVWSNEPLTRGLAKLSKTNLHRAPEDADEVIAELTSGSGLLVLGDAWSRFDGDDPDYAYTRLRNLEECWWRPLCAALKAHELNSLTITDCNLGAVTIQDWNLRIWPRWMRFST